MTKLLRKRDLVNFAVCYVTSIALTVMVDGYILQNYGDTGAKFFYILIIGFPIVFQFLAIYFVYLLALSWVVMKVERWPTKTLAILISSLLFVAAIIYFNWQTSKEMFHSFNEYIKSANVYIIFAVVSALQISLRKYSERKEIEVNHSQS